MNFLKKTRVQRCESQSQIVIRTACNQEYGFGILSPVTRKITPIENNYSSEAEHNNQDGFESWSVSMYQSLYHATETTEEVVEGDDELEGSENSIKSIETRKPVQKKHSHSSQCLHRQRKESWLLVLAHLPERLHQQLTERHRFNINNVSNETREELKTIYVY